MNAATKVVLTAELSGKALDWAAAAAHGQQVEVLRVPLANSDGHALLLGMNKCITPRGTNWDNWSPTYLPDQAWQLLEAHIKRAGEACEPVQGWDDNPGDRKFFAINRLNQSATASCLRVAVCRAVVLAVLGDAVEVPAVLVDEVPPCL